MASSTRNLKNNENPQGTMNRPKARENKRERPRKQTAAPSSLSSDLLQRRQKLVRLLSLPAHLPVIRHGKQNFENQPLPLGTRHAVFRRSRLTLPGRHVGGRVLEQAAGAQVLQHAADLVDKADFKALERDMFAAASLGEAVRKRGAEFDVRDGAAVEDGQVAAEGRGAGHCLRENTRRC